MVVVLPEPLTPITRMTCGRGKPQTSSGLATGARIFSISSARMVRRPRSSSCSKRRAAIASRMRFDASGPRSEAISASSISSRVACRAPALGRRPDEILAEPVRGFLEAACQAFEPTHSKVPIRWSPSRPMMRGRAKVAARRAGNADRREAVAVALVAILDQHRLAGADQAVEPARCAAPPPPRAAARRAP